MAAGTLTGHAVKMVGLPADHTYVTSSAGHVWQCNGRGAGGTVVCSGNGNMDQADCLSQPGSHAGVQYGITGVCHQMANRILYPAGQTVARANKYRWSSFAYGTYGKDPLTGGFYSPPMAPWPELAICRTHRHP
jgi:hypothetical protein